MVPSGPMPGSTPISVPTVTPIRQYSRFCSENATSKPWIRLPNKSMTASVAPEQRIGEAEPPDEQGDREPREDHRQEHDLDQLELWAGERGAEDQHDQRRHEAGMGHEYAEQDEGERQQDHTAQRPGALDTLLAAQSCGQQVEPEQ